MAVAVDNPPNKNDRLRILGLLRIGGQEQVPQFAQVKPAWLGHT